MWRSVFCSISPAFSQKEQNGPSFTFSWLFQTSLPALALSQLPKRAKRMGWYGAMEKRLWAERTTSNRRKPRGFGRDVPSCIVTYPYPAKISQIPCRDVRRRAQGRAPGPALCIKKCTPGPAFQSRLGVGHRRNDDGESNISPATEGTELGETRQTTPGPRQPSLQLLGSN